MCDSRTNDPKRETSLFDRLVGHSNASEIEFNGMQTMALIDSGAMVTTVSQAFFEQLVPTPVLHTLEELKLSVKGADDKEIPYIGYIEACIRVPKLTDESFPVPVLVVCNTDFNSDVPVIIGTNVIRYMSSVDKSKLSEEWKAALLTISTQESVGTVKTTGKAVSILPFETVTVSGIMRKTSDCNSAVTEQSPLASTRLGICPRVVNLNIPGTTVRVPVRIFNMSAKTICLPPNSVVCDLHDVTVLRSWTPENSQPTEKPSLSDHYEIYLKEQFLKNIKVNLDHLETDKKLTLENFFWKWRNVFSQGPLDIGKTNIVKHEIKLDNPEPFKEPYRPM
jgi:hypothetical protein